KVPTCAFEIFERPRNRTTGRRPRAPVAVAARARLVRHSARRRRPPQGARRGRSMTATNPLPIFDGHNDTLLSLHFAERGGGRTFFERSDQGHIDLPRAREGGLGGGFCAVFVPSEKTEPVPADPDKAAQQALAAFGDERTMPP